MEPRAVPARESLAPLTVLVPVLGTVVGAAWAFTITPPLAFLPIACGLLAAVLAMLLVFAVAPGAPGFCET